jgi:hypothetical protein
MTQRSESVSSNLQFPAFARLRRVGNKHHLSGIEKVKRIAVRVSMKPLRSVFSRLALPPASLPKTFQRVIEQLESKVHSQLRMPVIIRSLLVAN